MASSGRAPSTRPSPPAQSATWSAASPPSPIMPSRPPRRRDVQWPATWAGTDPAVDSESPNRGSPGSARRTEAMAAPRAGRASSQRRIRRGGERVDRDMPRATYPASPSGTEELEAGARTDGAVGTSASSPHERNPIMPADPLQGQVVKYLTDVHGTEENAIQMLRTGSEAVEDERLAAVLR